MEINGIWIINILAITIIAYLFCLVLDILFDWIKKKCKEFVEK